MARIKAQVVSVTETNTTVKLESFSHLVLINEGSETVYFNISGTAITAADTNPTIAAGTAFDASIHGQVLQVICAAGKSSSLRVISWRE